MKYRTILVAYDKSEEATNAVKAAVDMALDSSECEVHVLSVMPSMVDTVGFSGVNGDILGATNISFDGELLGQLQDSASAQRLLDMHTALDQIVEPLEHRCTMEAVLGTSPATGILRYSKTCECDIIVMGCRGLGALRGLLGSVSFAVLRSSHVPVLIVK